MPQINGSIIVKNKNLEILFNDLIFDQKTIINKTNDNVKFIEKFKGLEIYSKFNHT